MISKAIKTMTEESYQSPRPKTARTLNFRPGDNGRPNTAGSGTTRTYISVNVLRPAFVYVWILGSEQWPVWMEKSHSFCIGMHSNIALKNIAVYETEIKIIPALMNRDVLWLEEKMCL